MNRLLSVYTEMMIMIPPKITGVNDHAISNYVYTVRHRLHDFISVCITLFIGIIIICIAAAWVQCILTRCD